MKIFFWREPDVPVGHYHGCPCCADGWVHRVSSDDCQIGTGDLCPFCAERGPSHGPQHHNPNA